MTLLALAAAISGCGGEEVYPDVPEDVCLDSLRGFWTAQYGAADNEWCESRDGETMRVPIPLAGEGGDCENVIVLDSTCRHLSHDMICDGVKRINFDIERDGEQWRGTRTLFVVERDLTCTNTVVMEYLEPFGTSSDDAGI